MPAPAVQILVYDGYDETDAIGPYEVLAAAGFPVRLVTLDGAAPTVRAAHGLVTGVDGALDETAGGILVVPGGGFVSPDGGTRRALAEGLVASAIARAHANGAVIASVCTGAVLCEAAGLYDGRPVVTHRAALDHLTARGVDVRPEARVVDDGDVVSSGGVTSGIDMSFHLVERYLGREAAERGATRMEHERRGPVLVTDRAAAAAAAVS